MVKTIGYHIFALVYFVCKLFPVQDKRVFCIMTHDDGEGSNVSLLIKELKKRRKAYYYNYITKTHMEAVKGLRGFKKVMSFFIIKPYQLARSSIVLMDNVFLPLAYLRLKKNVKVIQLWHGTGTIKKFGQDTNTGKLKELEKRANSNITHLIVNDKKTGRLYAKVFAVDINKVYPVGLPKTDDILRRKERFEKEGISFDKTFIYKKYKIARDKKLILYAPTFRDNNLSSETLLEQVEELAKQLPREYILGIHLHPHVAGLAKKKALENVCDLSGDGDLVALIMASDMLITDYSSIIFEYCITERPMIFFAYDFEEFSDQGRGFYEDYESYVPGPVVKTSKEVVDIIREDNYALDKIRAFNHNNFPNLDGKACQRIIKLIES
ncbi:MAG: hypothetical protein GX321_06730 [Clostridiales bacterium]|nr:hypothetical protein [Clostridiales bacterium]